MSELGLPNPTFEEIVLLKNERKICCFSDVLREVS
jgi:hypothetical protein